MQKVLQAEEKGPLRAAGHLFALPFCPLAIDSVSGHLSGNLVV